MRAHSHRNILEKRILALAFGCFSKCGTCNTMDEEIDLKSLPLASDRNSLESCRLRYGPRESWRLLKNLIVLGFAFLMIFSAFLATVNLQSSINHEEGLGTWALASLYAAYILASLFMPPLVIYKLRAKTTIILSISGYVLYVAAQFHPTFFILVPAAAYSGLCGGNLWTASGAYITRISREYAHLNHLSFSSVFQQFFGTFFLFFHSSQIWGNLISTSVLSSGSDPLKEHHSNFSHALQKDLSMCGAQFCPFSVEEVVNRNLTGNLIPLSGNSSSSAFAHPEMSKINLLFGIYTGFSVAAAIIVFFFLDSSARYGELDLSNKTNVNINALELFVATIKHWRKPTQILIIPITVWTGMQEAFVGAEFTMAFITCAWGVEYIGLVMLCYGICASLSSIVVGRCTERLGRPAVFCTACALNLGCLIAMLHWSPSPDQTFVYFVLTGAWGASDGVWSAQVRALYADIFPRTAEPAFSNAGIWIAVGFIIVYIVSGRLCMAAKTYLCIGVVVLAVACYLGIEVIEKRKERHRKAVALTQQLQALEILDDKTHEHEPETIK